MSEVKIYSTPTCIWCEKTKEFFKKNKVKFTDYDVSKDRKAAHEMMARSGQMGVTVIVIGKKIIIGYNEEELKKAFKKR